MNAHRQAADQPLPDALCAQLTTFLAPQPPPWDTDLLSLGWPSLGGPSLGWLSLDSWRWPHWSFNWPRSLSWGHYVPMAVLGMALGLTLAVPQAAAAEPKTVTRTEAQVSLAAPVGRTVTVKLDPGLAAMRTGRKKAVEPAHDAHENAVSARVPPAQSAYATLPGEAAPSPKPRKSQGREGPQLEIQADVFNQEQVRGLAEDWLVPLLIEGLIRERLATSKEG